MPVVQNRIKEISAVDRIPADLLDPWALAFFEDHPVKEFITLFNADVFAHNVVNIVIGVQHFHFHMKETWLTLYPDEVARVLIEQLAIYINLHVGTLVRLDGNTRNVCIRVEANDQ